MSTCMRSAAAPSPVAPAPFALLQRCPCGGSRTSSAGACEECRARRRDTQGRASGRWPALARPWRGGTPAPPIVHDVLGASGRQLEPGVRLDMERRFGRSFAAVRIHDDAVASQSARVVGALAWAVGDHLAFRAGQYRPATTEGRRLLAHELAHVAQERRGSDTASTSPRNIAVRPVTSPEEREAEQLAGLVAAAPAAASATPPRTGAGTGSARAVRPQPVPAAQPAGALRRRIALDDPTGLPAGAPAGQTKEVIVRDYVRKLCPDFTVTGDKVQPRTAGGCADPAASSAPVACGCMCDMHALTDASGAPITWTIAVNDDDWPHTDSATRTVTVHSPFSGVAFGAWSPGDASATPAVPVHLQSLPNWLVLGHELCGHAHLFARGTHPTGPAPTGGGRPSHDPTVTIENQIAAEHGIPAAEQRGLFSDPHHGESVATVEVTGFASSSADVSALPPVGRAQLDTAERFALSPRIPVLLDVLGHADQTGTPAANADISRRRANAVRDELRSRGVTRRQWRTVRGEGATECAAPGDQPDCRRVEVRMFIMEGGSVGRP
jgi:outer membrane protein OmpA-like peptidoglycan-associated protein